MDCFVTIFGYLGPETMLPVTSVVAGALGVVMLLGRSSLRWAAGMVRSLASFVGPGSKPADRPRRPGAGPAGRIGSPSRPRPKARARA